MQRKARTLRSRKNRRRLRAEALEQRRLLAVDTSIFDFDAAGSVNLFGSQAAGELENKFGQNSDGAGGIIATNNVEGLNDMPSDLAPIGSQTVDELNLLTFTATATDADTPSKTFTYSLAGAVPAGAAITPTGDFTWTPTEAQGPGTFSFDVVATEDSAPNLSVSETITITVNEINVVPVLAPIGNQTVDEESALNFTATASDVDAPANALTFSLAGAVPVGASITDGGEFNWTPTEVQGPGSYTFDVVVSDGGTPDLTDSETITVTVNEANRSPVITSDGGGLAATVSAAENQSSVTTVTATDQDLPADTLTFSITGGADQALFSIVPGTGVLTFNTSPDFENPSDAGLDNVYNVQVSVTDNGVPSLSDVQDIAITVTNGNEVPVITSDGGGAAASLSATENQTAVTTVTASDEDLPAQSLSFSITGGADQALFGIVASTGVLTFNTAPDFENPSDAGLNNVFDVQVTVTDNGVPSLTDVQDITITVGDDNEAPVITSSGGGPTAAVNVAENQAAVTTVVASDQDLPAQTLTYSITGGADQALFSIVPGTGVLTFNTAPDFENPTDTGADNVYDVQVSVTDNGVPSLSDVQDIAITVTNGNEVPVITSDGGGAAASLSATENQTAVTTVTASDADLPAQTLSFSITGGADQALFGIVASTGVLTFNTAPDFENPSDAGLNNVYDVQVTVTDNGVPSLTDVQDIAVSVTDVNDAPVITSNGGGANAAIDVAENQTAVTTITASDQDLPAQTLTFSITGGADQGLFGIVPGTGVLTFNASPDSDHPADAGANNVYDVQVTVTDSGAPNLSDIQDIAITVTDLNEAPVITSNGSGAAASLSAAENQTAVTTVTASDEDLPAQSLSFSITGGADQALFGIVASTGVLTFNTAPDFENPSDAGLNNVYDVQVTVTDNGVPSLTDVQDIAVSVTDVNDAPVITSNGGGTTAAVNAAENQTAVTTVTASDQDLPSQTFTFSITGGADQGLFGIVPGSGVLTFNASPDSDHPADAGANNVYDVQVTVTDSGAPNLTDVQDIAVTVTDLNEAPVITSNGGGAAASLSAAENQTAVTTVTASDADLPAQTLTFSITGGADQALFGIVASTGVLTFNSAPDFENPADTGANNIYDVQVTVTDNGAPNLTDVQDIAVAVTNINEAPVITSNGGGTTAAVNAAENQTAVTTVTASDQDLPSQTFTFSITGGADQGLFGIVPGTGVLTFNASPDSDHPADAGANNVYDVQVTVTDNGAPNLTDVQDIAVTVTDLNEAPVITSNGGGAAASLSAAENQTAVTTVTASDEDLPAQTLTFSISGGADQALFGIVASTGVLTFNGAPDFENPADAGANNIYDVQVTVTDNGAPNLSDIQDIAVIVTNVNKAPVITSDGGRANAAIDVAENQTAVTTITASDQDLPAQTLTYSITGGADQGLFGIVPGTGVLTFIAAPDFDNPADAGANNVYDVQVTVTDNGAPNLTDVQDIAVTVTDLNEAPVITSNGGGAAASLSAAENQTAVTTVTASDVDLPAQTLTFSISGGADQALFGIVASTGVLTFNGAPDFENPADAGANNIYDVQVTVTDNGAPNLSDIQDIAVIVTDINEAPVITSNGGGATAAVNAAENQTAVATITASDQDLPAQTLTYSITGGADQALFGIVPGTGVLTFSAAPDFENPIDAGANNVYDVQVTVTDNGAPNLTDVQDIAIAVTDLKEAPVITSNGGGAAASLNAAENQTAVTTVTASDEDLPAQTLTFSISGGADQALFGIVASTGVLTFNSAPDFENPADVGANNTYDVQVTVTDNGAPNLLDVQDIAVTVTDANDAPVITSNGGGATAAVNAAENQTAVTTVTHTDEDLPAQAITYSITGGADQALFGIVASTGVLTFNAAPDFENPADAGANNIYDVQVKATDNGAPNLAEVQNIAITVTDINDAPVITSNGGGATAAINAAENQTAVTTVTASDQDLPAQMLTFTITGGTDQALFGIVANTGVLTFNAAPDFENAGDAGANNVYDVQVTVTDNGVPSLADVQDIAVTVTDVNEAPSLSLDDDNSSASAPDSEALFYTGFGTPVSIADADVNVSDPDAPGTISSATVTITNIQNPLDETLAATPSGSILPGDISYAAATGILTINKVASIADYEAVLASVTYDNSATSLALLPSRIVDFVVNDGALSSTVVSSTITVLDRPQIDLDDDNSSDTGDDFATSFVEDAGAVSVVDSDVDIVAPLNITTATFVLTNRPDGTAESLSVSGPLLAGLTVSDVYDNADGQLVISGSSSGAIYESVIQQFEYNNTSNTPNTSDRIVTVVIRDASTLDSFASTTTISVTATNDPPDDSDESYGVQSNVGLNVNAADGLLSGATDPEGNTPVVLAAASVGTFATTAGGSITTSADGSFTYTPEAGDANVADTFIYTAQDSIGDTSTSTVTFNVNAETIWFVDTAAAASGDGTFSSPFNTLADLDAGGASDALDDAGDAIFVFSSDASIPSLTLSDDFDLETGQLLIGEDAAGTDLTTLNTLVSFATQTDSLTLTGFSNDNAVLSTGGSDAIMLASGNTVRGIDIGNTGAGHAIFGSGFGTLTIDDVGITGTGAIMNLNTGAITDPNGGTTFANLISTSNPGSGIDLDAVGGAFTVGGATNISGGTKAIEIDGSVGAAAFDFGATTIGGGADTGITLNTSGSATFTFDSLSINNDNGNGLQANDAGTINIGGGSNSISTVNGTVVDLTNTTIGNGLGGAGSFDTLSSSNSGGKGIQLNTVAGSLTVSTSTSINTSADTGVDINNSGGAFSFGDLDISNTPRGLRVSNTGTVNTTSGTISTVSGTGVDLNNVTLGIVLTGVSASSATNGIKLVNTSGSFTVTGDGSTATQGGNDTGGIVENLSGAAIVLNNATNVTLNNMTIGDPTASASDSPDATNNIGGDGIDALDVTGLTLNNVTIARTGGHGVSGTNVTNFTLDDSLILNAGDGAENGLDFSELRGDNFVTDSLFDAFNRTGIEVTNSSGTVDLTVSETTFQDNNATVGNAGEDAISLTASGTAQIVALVTGVAGVGTNSIFDDLAFQAVHAISDGTTSSIDLTVENSRFLESSASDGVIIMNPDNGGIGNLTVNDNFFTDDTNGTFAIRAHNESTGTLDVTVQGNTTQFAQLLDLDHDHLGSSGPANGTTRALIGGSGTGEGNSVFVGERKTGINIVATEDDPNNNLDLSATILNNIVTVTNVGPITSVGGIQINASKTTRANIDLRGNVSNGVPPTFAEGLVLATANTAEIGIEGLVGAVSVYLNSVNIFTLGYSASFDGTGNFSTGSPDSVVATTRPNPLMATSEGAGDADELDQDALAPVVAEAISRLAGAGLTAEQVEVLESTQVTVAELPSTILGWTNSQGQITIDSDAAGWGWFVDTTPSDDLEFGDDGVAEASSDAHGKMDLLTVVMHELRHVLGETHTEDVDGMAETLSAGRREVPGHDSVDDDLLDLLASDQANLW